MEGPVLTESEVWKVDEPKTDYPPLANDGDEDFSKATPLVSEHTAKEAETHEETSPDLPEPDLGSEVDSINEKICKDRRVIQTENKQKSLLDESNQKINHEENKHENNKEENKEMKKGNIEEIKHEMNQEKGENDQSEKQQGNRQDYCQVENRDNSVDKQEIISEIQQPIVQELDQGVNQKNTTGVKHQENCVENTQQNKQDMDNPELGVNKEDNLDGKQEVKKENNQEDHEEDSVEINQEITILVTSHDCGTEDEEDEKQTLEELEPEQEPVLNVETEDECLDGSIVVANMIEVSEVQTTNLINCTSTSNNEDVVNSKKETNSESTDSSFAQKNEAANMDSNTPDSVSSLKDQADVNQNKSQNKTETLSLSRSPGRTQTVQTQVSLEVMYQSVATSPMTPPEGSTGFIFPTTFGKFASKTVTESFNTKDAEMQAGLQPEFRSVATAPMTPLVLTAPELIPEPEPRIGVSNEEKPEPVQEVSWDEKGMTWEVYGAAVEVAVLGTAIQKHLEKQVKKKKPAPIEVIPEDMNETSAPMPSSPPPVLELSENVPEESEEKPEQRSRHQDSRFRRWLRNILRPRCCSRARGDKDD